MIPSQLPEPAYAAVVALDCANRQARLGLVCIRVQPPSTRLARQPPKAIARWASGLDRANPDGSIAVVLVNKKHTAVLHDVLRR